MILPFASAWGGSLNHGSDYLLIAQNTAGVEHYIRQKQNQWLFSEYKDMEESFRIDSVYCELMTKEIYEKVGFDVDGV